MYRIILKVLVYYQLLRDAQDSRRDVQKELDELKSWCRNEMEPEFFRLQATIDDLKMTNQNLTKEKVNRTPNNNNNYVNNINYYIIILITI